MKNTSGSPVMIRLRSYAACLVFPLAASAALLALSGCKSEWVETTVENRTGQAIRELEVDYPSASFGKDSLAGGASMHYRFKILGSGPVKVEYTFDNGKASHGEGLTLTEHQHGTLVIRLLPVGKVEFVTNLQPAS